jgi:oligoribonuclease
MRLIWLDLETTGLDPNKNTILEVAAFEADLKDPFTLTPLVEMSLWWPPDLVPQLDQFVQTMHTKNALFVDCSHSKAGLFDAEEALLAKIPAADNYEDAPVLAGSSIHFDAAFIKMYMPRLAARFHHRHYDVSAVKLFAESLGMPKIPRGEAHRAAADVMESVEHAKKCAEWLSQLGAVTLSIK